SNLRQNDIDKCSATPPSVSTLCSLALRRCKGLVCPAGIQTLSQRDYEAWSSLGVRTVLARVTRFDAKTLQAIYQRAAIHSEPQGRALPWQFLLTAEPQLMFHPK